MTEAQWRALWPLLLARSPGDFHEGDCIGSDAQAAHAARAAGFRIIGHPPTNNSKRAYFPADETKFAHDYLTRNRLIVGACKELIATPGEMTEQLRSGTWSTVRYARRGGWPVVVILPDGSMQVPG